jgi:hypothetical protein
MLAAGVGHAGEEPPPLAEVGSAAVCRRKHRPLRIEPEVGQRSENGVESSKSDSCDVLHEDISRSHFANDSVHLPPEAAALAGETCAFAGDADVLAGKATGNDIDSPSPCGPVELGNVIVDLQLGRQPTFVASCLQNGAAVRVDLHRAHRTVAQQHAAEDAAACAGEQMQFPHVTLQTIAWRPLLRCRRMPLSATRPHSTSSARRVRMPLADCIGALLLR